MARRTKAEQRDAAVEDALFRKAAGGHYAQEESYKLKRSYYDEQGKKVEEERVEIVEVQKYMIPEFSAIALWLKARLPACWGDATGGMTLPTVHIIDDIPACDPVECAVPDAQAQGTGAEKDAV